MHILLTQIKDGFTQVISYDTNNFKRAKVTGLGTMIYSHSHDTIVVLEPIAFIINAVNHQVRLYYVKPGDTLSEVALSLGVTVEHLLTCNPSVRNPNVIFINQVLKY